MKTWLRIFLPLTMLLALGFIRDFFFLNVNDQLYKLYFGNYEFELPALLKVLESLSYMQLYYFKYLLTGIFLVMYGFTTHWGLKFCLPGKPTRKLTFFVFLSITIFSALLFAGGWLIGKTEQGYLAARGVLGVLQSPVPFMILFPGLMLRKSSS